jgi:hypothetical protein
MRGSTRRGSDRSMAGRLRAGPREATLRVPCLMDPDATIGVGRGRIGVLEALGSATRAGPSGWRRGISPHHPSDDVDSAPGPVKRAAPHLDTRSA